MQLPENIELQLVDKIYRYRKYRDFVLSGLTKDQANERLLASERSRPTTVQDIADSPEAAIFSIVVEYIDQMALIGSWPWQKDINSFDNANLTVLQAIERSRSLIAKGSQSFPVGLPGYVIYRMRLERPERFGELGLVAEIITKQVEILKTGITDAIRRGASGNSTSAGQGSGACFVATACYGSAHHPTVLTLRRYREVVLKKNKLGRFLIKKYYSLSPPLASFITRHQNIRLLTTAVLSGITSALRAIHRI